MPEFKEELLHFIWKYKLLKHGIYKSVKGATLKIIHPGELNANADPDFFNAKIEVDGLLLAGNVEIHIKSSDWLKHGHQRDSSYDNLILHAVYKSDKAIEQNSSNNVEVFELKDHIPVDVFEKYQHLVSSKKVLSCSANIRQVDPLKLSSWVQRMLVERLENKVRYVQQLFELCNNDYAQCFYTLLARNFGFKVNADPFEMLAKHLPLQVLLKHKDNLFQLEALLYGISGMLEDSFEDKYLRQLQNEFEFLRNKYRLIPLDKKVWKFSRMRPANFPSVRIWQFAAIIHHCPELFSWPLNYASREELRRAVAHAPDGYWLTHYKMGGNSVSDTGSIGENSIDNIIINTFAPYLFFYGRQNGKEEYGEAALSIMEEIYFEENSKTSMYTKAGLTFKNAGESQALIHLHDNYCAKKACLNCGIASELLTGRKY